MDPQAWAAWGAGRAWMPEVSTPLCPGGAGCSAAATLGEFRNFSKREQWRPALIGALPERSDQMHQFSDPQFVYACLAGLAAIVKAFRNTARPQRRARARQAPMVWKNVHSEVSIGINVVVEGCGGISLVCTSLSLAGQSRTEPLGKCTFTVFIA